MSESTAVVASERKAITVTVAERYGMEADTFEIALRNTVFLEGSKAEYAAFLVVCNEYKLNPLTKEIYAFKNKAGKIVPVVSIDGWVSLCNTHPQFDGMTFEDQVDEDGKLYAITCTIYRKDRSHPTVIPEYLSECIRNTDPWKMQHRMLRHKALIQCARYAFGFSGIYDQDEAERIEVTVLPDGEPAQIVGAADFKPAKARKAAKGAEVAPEPEEASHARQEAAQDAEFECAHQWHDTVNEDEEVCAACGMVRERPTTAGGDTATASAPAAETQQDVSASASDAPDASQAETDSSQPKASEPTSNGAAAPPDTLYRLEGDEVDEEDHRVPTYKNGVLFSRVKPDAKTAPPIYEAHAPRKTYAPAAAQEAPASEFDQDEDAPTVDASTPAAAIRAAPDFDAARAAMREANATSKEPDFRRGLRLALWNRYGSLKDEGIDVPEISQNYVAMRLWIEFGFTDLKQLEPMWGPFYRSPAFREASETDQNAIRDAMLRKQEELRDGLRR